MPKDKTATIQIRPLLRWAGGKHLLVRSLMKFLPSDIQSRTYYEPFLGAGSLFFSLGHPNARLSDLNGHLVDCYRAIRDNPVRVAKALRVHAAHDCEEYYYGVRDQYNRSRSGIARAARFLYLN